MRMSRRRLFGALAAAPVAAIGMTVAASDAPPSRPSDYVWLEVRNTTLAAERFRIAEIGQGVPR